jgi:hypothetical protein
VSTFSHESKSSATATKGSTASPCPDCGVYGCDVNDLFDRGMKARKEFLAARKGVTAAARRFFTIRDQFDMARAVCHLDQLAAKGLEWFDQQQGARTQPV